MRPAIGPSRAPDFDVLPGFRSPPLGYGEVAFYWWLGDKLTKERLAWQLNQMAGWKISGLQVNYAHGTKGGLLWGLTYPSDPPLFSESWWELYTWFQREAEKRGIAVSLSDYTLGSPGQGYYIDEILAEHPEMAGYTLEPRIDEDGTVTVQVIRHPQSLDPMHPRAGAEVIAKFFQRFEDRLPGKAGTGLNYFFSDELNFGVSGNLWNDRFAGEFAERKGYDLVPLLPHLFADLGPTTPKIRLDYRDVMVALEEEHYFAPVYQWHQDRGMTYGCDHGGRGKEVLEFGDYFRTQKWNQAPGNDNPNLESDLIKNKVASSIAHLYERPRTWLEGFYGSGWGTSSADLADALARNFVMGHNLVSLHGLYYSTHGGWWEWAPPCNHWRMPYAAHMRTLLDFSERVSFLLSQGVHRCDVALMYPVAPSEAGLGGEESVATAFALARTLFDAGLDFDFLDAESLDRCRVHGGKLTVAGEAYRVLILPAMRAMRHSGLLQAARFHRAGGLVLAVGALPEASDRLGFGDPEVAALTEELFAATGAFVPDAAAALERVRTLPADFQALDLSAGERSPWVHHRRIGARDVYAVYGATPGRRCRFRSHGAAELWNPWSATTAPVASVADGDHTTVELPGTTTELQLVVFDARRAPSVVVPPTPRSAKSLDLAGPWRFELLPTRDNQWGDFALPATPGLIGPEVSFLRLEDTTVQAGYGPFWEVLGPEKGSAWQPYVYSERFGLADDPGEQGYHGLKGEIDGAFLVTGTRKPTLTGAVYELPLEGAVQHFRTNVEVPTRQVVDVLAGPGLPARITLDGQEFPGAVTTLVLEPGQHRLEITYDQPGRAWFHLAAHSPAVSEIGSVGLASPWFRRSDILRFDPYPGQTRREFRFVAAPGLRALQFRVHGSVRVNVEGQAPATLVLERDGVQGDLVHTTFPAQLEAATEVIFEIDALPGYPGAAVLATPITQDCGEGTLRPGDWSQIEGLFSYSGGARYTTNFEWNGAETEKQFLLLDLGRVISSAQVTLNGSPLGIRVAPPFTFPLGSPLQAGRNSLEVVVYNTLANHYTTIPTRYRGKVASGLIGPVRITTARFPVVPSPLHPV